MHDRSPVRAIVFLLLVLAGAAAIGIGAYNAGVQRGFVDASASAVPPEAATHVHVWAGPGHGGYFPIFPLFVGFFLVAFLLRRGPWRGGRGCGPRGGGGGVPPAFDEWHRRAHERMGPTPPAPDRSA